MLDAKKDPDYSLKIGKDSQVQVLPSSYKSIKNMVEYPNKTN